MSLYLNDVARRIHDDAVREIAAVNSPDAIQDKLLDLLTEKGYLAETAIHPVETYKGKQIGIEGRPKKRNDGYYKWILTFSEDSVKKIKAEIKTDRSFFEMPAGRSEYRRFFKGSSKYGQYYSFHTYQDFASTGENAWLNEMRRGANRLRQEHLSDSQTDAWTDCRDVLRDAYASLPSCYEDARLLFEYSLPQLKPDSAAEEKLDPTRSDVLLLMQDSVLALEFKQRSPEKNGTIFEGLVRQAMKYRTRLERFHMVSSELDISCALVLTQAFGVFEKRDEKTYICSPDKLPKAITAVCGTNPKAMTEVAFKAWLDSEFAELPSQE